MIAITAYGVQHIRYVKFIAMIKWISIFRDLIILLSSLLYTNVIVGLPISRMVNNEEIIIMFVGMNIPKIKIHTIYVLLLSLVCQSGAQPTPESSGTYLPQPKTGGILSARAYIQMKNINSYVL